ncbi:MAG: hypothetical protein ACFFCE_14015 [Promethearchaeota archaeon]
MQKFIKTLIYKKRKQKIVLISFILFSTILFNSTFFNHILHVNSNVNNTNEYLEEISYNPESANSNSVIFEGIEPVLNITDYGVLYEKNQYTSILNQEKLNLSYYLDDVHDWKASKIENTIKNIQDKRNWINNSGFLSPTIYRVYGEWNTTHPYQQNNNIIWGNPDHEIIVSGATYIRVHFTEVFFEPYYDFLYITNGTNIYYVNSSGDTDFYSPWLRGEIFRLYYYSNNNNEFFGYYVDYYEYVNSTSNIDINSNDWKFKYQEVENGFNYNGVADVNGSNAMYIALLGEYVDTDQFDYDTGAFSEIYQEFVIPSGPFVDAYLSFDYYCQYALPTNDHYIYVKLNDQKIFSKGMLDISDLGKRKWLSSGKLHIDAWDNKTQIFNENLYQQTFNISLGFKIGAGYLYTGMYDEGLTNIIYFDNISLTVTSKANSTQNFIDLRINGDNLNDLDKWGYSNKSIIGLWDSNPVILSLSSSSPHLTFDMNTTIYGYRNGSSKINQQGSEGISYQILNNGTIYWEFLHNLYTPTDYTDNSFIIEKPREWNFLNVKDPTLKNIPFELGKSDEQYLKINKTFALYPGWWHFKATSPNYLNDSNTKFFKQGQWVERANFTTGESTQITTQLSNMGKIPKDTSQINLTIYHPDGTIFYEESLPPNNGNVTFSEITFGALNTIGGIYEYTLFWSNGTVLGGFKSDFIVKHQSSILLLKPDDAKLDLSAESVAGDIIPIRIYLKDAENDLYISNASITYNWTTGIKYFVEAALGIYETILDTSDLGGFGLYNIFINSSKLGFINSNLTLTINLGENTNLQRLDSDSKIVINENSTIRFYYYSEFDEEGITGAQVLVNISNSNYFSIQDESNGIYSIEFSTEFFNKTGMYRLIFEFISIGYEPQIHIYQFEIINPKEIPEEPNFLLWAILFISIGIASIFAVLSLRSYILLPRKRRKEADLLARTQKFKDLKNIQAIVIIHRLSGIPIYSKSYSILEKHKKELFSGFIQAITMVAEEFYQKETVESQSIESKETYGVEKMIELDFKQFYCLIADIEDLRAVFILEERSSERMKSIVSHLMLALNLKLSTQLENWDGSLDQFEILVPEILIEYFELYYKDSFKLAGDINLIKIKKERNLTKMEMRLINVIPSMSKDNIITNLNNIIEMIHEENKNLVIEAIESLIKQKIIIPLNN